MPITRQEKLLPEIEKQMRAEFEQYEAQHGVMCNFTPFYFAAEEGADVAGVIAGYTCYAEIYR